MSAFSWLFLALSTLQKWRLGSVTSSNLRCHITRYSCLILHGCEGNHIKASKLEEIWTNTFKIWNFQCGDHKQCLLLGYKNLVHTSQGTHYISIREPSLLILCKVCGFHCGDYEECLLRYRILVHTSQGTHYISVTETNLLILCKVWGFHCGDYEEAVFWYDTPCGYCKNDISDKRITSIISGQQSAS
jgi:hypothetical protein